MDSKNYLLVEDVADTLGISKATVHDWVCRRTIPHTKLPGKRRILFPRDQFDRYAAGESELEERRLPNGGRVVSIKGRAPHPVSTKTRTGTRPSRSVAG